jgi:hypothetical protein
VRPNLLAGAQRLIYGGQEPLHIRPDVVDAFLGISEEVAVDLRQGSVTTATRWLVRLHSDPEDE